MFPKRAISFFLQMGYATRALQLLSAYYEGKITNLDENTVGDDDAEALTTSATVLLSEYSTLYCNFRTDWNKNYFNDAWFVFFVY